MATEHHDDHHGISHVAAIKVLLATGGSLLLLTILTVAATKIDFGANINLAIAMVIAVTKATLVILFFMHMTEAAATNRIVFVTSFVFMLVMIFGVFGDLWTRSQMSLPNHVPSTEGPEIPVFEGGSLPPPGHHE